MPRQSRTSWFQFGWMLVFGRSPGALLGPVLWVACSAFLSCGEHVSPTGTTGPESSEGKPANPAGDSTASMSANPSPTAAEPVAGAELWLRADQGVVLASDTHVSDWSDQTGHGHDGAMDSAERQPVLVTGALNGLPVLHFSGAQSLYLSTIVAPMTFTVFALGRNTNPDESQSIILGPGGPTANNQFRWQNGHSVECVGQGNGMPELVTEFGDTRTFHIYSLRYDGVSITVFRNNDQLKSYPITTSAPWELAQVGGWFSSEFMIGDLAEVLLYDAALSNSDFAQNIGYLSDKYGLGLPPAEPVTPATTTVTEPDTTTAPPEPSTAPSTPIADPNAPSAAEISQGCRDVLDKATQCNQGTPNEQLFATYRSAYCTDPMAQSLAACQNAANLTASAANCLAQDCTGVTDCASTLLAQYALCSL